MRVPHKITILAGSFALTHALAAEYDLVIYGGTASGVITAVQAKKIGRRCVCGVAPVSLSW